VDLIRQPLEIEHRLAGNSGGGALLREQAELCVLAHGQEPARPRENERDRYRHRRPYRPPLPAQREIDDHGRRDANSDVADQDASCEDESQNDPGGHTIAASGPDSGQDREQLAQQVKRLRLDRTANPRPAPVQRQGQSQDERCSRRIERAKPLPGK